MWYGPPAPVGRPDVFGWDTLRGMGWETASPAGDRLGLPCTARVPAPLFVLCAEVERCGGAGMRDGPAAGLTCPGDLSRAEPLSGE